MLRCNSKECPMFNECINTTNDCVIIYGYFKENMCTKNFLKYFLPKDGKRKYLYHVTDKNNLSSILKNGLIGRMIHLSENKDSWKNEERNTILRVDVTGYYLSQVDDELDEFIIYDSIILPDRINIVDS